MVAVKGAMMAVMMVAAMVVTQCVDSGDVDGGSDRVGDVGGGGGSGMEMAVCRRGSDGHAHP